LQQLFVPLTHHGNIIKQLLVDKMQKGPLIRSRVPLHFVPNKEKEQVEQKDIVIGQIHVIHGFSLLYMTR
jgi:hypothetical protein